LINYPNDEDRRQFAQAKRRGAISRRAGIGGLIEIHGGGKDGQTYGCVSLDDHHMARFTPWRTWTRRSPSSAPDYETACTSAEGVVKSAWRPPRARPPREVPAPRSAAWVVVRTPIVFSC
jgi:hypothetical protein